ncbi:uncharacterized protein [Saccopteryx bilineata]|uniref:uncharacterized protein n=1 Tax=Saccopteryx bilineata TaxID=59482 RepID=UPI00338FE81E
MLLVASRSGRLPGAQGVPRPPAPRGSRRAAPTRRPAVPLQLRPPLNPAVRPLPPARDAPPRGRRWGPAARPFQWCRTRKAQFDGCLWWGYVRGVRFPNLLETAKSSVIGSPPPAGAQRVVVEIARPRDPDPRAWFCPAQNSPQLSPAGRLKVCRHDLVSLIHWSSIAGIKVKKESAHREQRRGERERDREREGGGAGSINSHMCLDQAFSRPSDPLLEPVTLDPSWLSWLEVSARDLGP